MLAGSIYYLDIFRERMTVERLEQLGISTQYAAAALAAAPPQSRLALAAQLGKATQSRISLYDDEGRLALASWSLTGDTYLLRSYEHTTELQSLMRTSFDVCCLKH